jgi:putative Mn2+ efflux pump MntP
LPFKTASIAAKKLRMQKSKLSIALFIILFSISGLFIGMFLSKFFIPEGVGLAGGAMVLSYGVAGFFISLIIGIFTHRFLSKNNLKWAIIIFGILVLTMIGWLVYKINAS